MSIAPSRSRTLALNTTAFWDANADRSNAAIATELGCHRRTVEKARRAHGVPALPRGRQYGDRGHRHNRTVTTLRSVPATTEPVVIAPSVTAELAWQQEKQSPASWQHALGHIADADRARKARDRRLERDAAIRLAATAIRVAEQLDRLGEMEKAA